MENTKIKRLVTNDKFPCPRCFKKRITLSMYTDKVLIKVAFVLRLKTRLESQLYSLQLLLQLIYKTFVRYVRWSTSSVSLKEEILVCVIHSWYILSSVERAFVALY